MTSRDHLSPPPRPVRLRGGRLGIVAGALIVSPGLLFLFFTARHSKLPAWYWPTFFTFTAVVPLAWIAYRLAREHALATRGLSAAATVTAFLPEVGRLPAGLKYEFRTGDGVTVDGQSRSRRLGRAKIGDKLPTVYDPARPTRHSLVADLAWVAVP
jgi:hypothetical protein